MPSSVRAHLAELVGPLVTENRWSIKPHTVKQVQTISRPTVFIEHTGIDPLPTAPVGSAENQCVVTFVSHLTDYAQAEDALDEDVLAFVAALDASDRLEWANARKVEIADTYLGWAITLTLITEKEA